MLTNYGKDAIDANREYGMIWLNRAVLSLINVSNFCLVRKNGYYVGVIVKFYIK